MHTIAELRAAVSPRRRNPKLSVDEQTCEKCSARSRIARFSRLCERCWLERMVKLRSVAARATATKRERYPERFPPTSEKFWQKQALSMVGHAIKQGILPALKGSGIACIDCGKPAVVYEHRDYRRPLDVVPACHSCNYLRGTAKWPSAADYSFTLVHVPPLHP